MSPRLARILRIVAITVIVVLAILFLRRIDWAELGRAFATAKLWPLLLSSLLYFYCLFGKALSWRIMLEPRRVSVWRLYRYTIAAWAASVLTPARAGELLRVWALKRRDGVPASESAGVALAEKLLLAVTLLVLVAPLPWLAPGLPAWVENTLLVCAIVAAALLVVLFVAAGRVDGRTPATWRGRFLIGVHIVREPKRLALTALTLLCTWIAELIAVSLVLHAVGIDIPLAGALFILFAFNLAIAIPSTPAQIGALQVGALVATNLLGIPHEPALAFALLYQAAQVVPLLIVGLVLELDLVRGRMPAEPQPAS